MKGAIDMLDVSSSFRDAYPGACIGILALENVTNAEEDPGLNARKKDLETRLRERFGGMMRADLLQMEPLRSYVAYYKRFRKTYHVLLQLESIISGGKDIPRANCLVEAMFMAELKNQILTAGHDRAQIIPPLQASVATGVEAFVTMSGRQQDLTAGDMYSRGRQRHTLGRAPRPGRTDKDRHPDDRSALCRLRASGSRQNGSRRAPRGHSRERAGLFARRASGDVCGNALTRTVESSMNSLSTSPVSATYAGSCEMCVAGQGGLLSGIRDRRR